MPVFPPHIELLYPILVVGGEIWSIDQTQEAPNPESVDRVNYQHSSFANGVVEEYIISVVTEKWFEQFVAQLELECAEIAARIQARIGYFEKAQKLISEMSDAEFSRLPVAVSPHLA